VLAQQADSALSTASDPETAAAKDIFLEVARLEKDFWQMAFAASS